MLLHSILLFDMKKFPIFFQFRRSDFFLNWLWGNANLMLVQKSFFFRVLYGHRGITLNFFFLNKFKCLPFEFQLQLFNYIFKLALKCRLVFVWNAVFNSISKNCCCLNCIEEGKSFNKQDATRNINKILHVDDFMMMKFNLSFHLLLTPSLRILRI